MKKTVLTVIGPDKPGIIAGISGVLSEKKCNMENITQTILQSEFAGICIVSIPDELNTEELQKIMVSELKDYNLQITVKDLDTEGQNSAETQTEPFIVSTRGPDRQGIVAVVSRSIADAGANITNLKAVFKGGKNPDHNIMIFEIDVPVSVDFQKFSAELKEKAREIDLDLNIQHRNIFDAVNRI